MADAFLFDHEKLDVYRIELESITWVTAAIKEFKEPAPEGREVYDHLDRASLSSLFNTAEGNGKRQMKTRAKFFDDARGSATECAACLGALVAKGICGTQRVRPGKELLHRIVSMLTKLVERYSGDSVREDGEPYGRDAVESCAEDGR
jgi:four helix bundle protein